MTARVNFADGSPGIQVDTVAEAVAYLRQTCAVVEEYGDRWLAWRTEEHANDDDGANAYAEIHTV